MNKKARVCTVTSGGLWLGTRGVQLLLPDHIQWHILTFLTFQENLWLRKVLPEWEALLKAATPGTEGLRAHHRDPETLQAAAEAGLWRLRSLTVWWEGPGVQEGVHLMNCLKALVAGGKTSLRSIVLTCDPPVSHALLEAIATCGATLRRLRLHIDKLSADRHLPPLVGALPELEDLEVSDLNLSPLEWPPAWKLQLRRLKTGRLTWSPTATLPRLLQLRGLEALSFHIEQRLTAAEQLRILRGLASEMRHLQSLEFSLRSTTSNDGDGGGGDADADRCWFPALERLTVCGASRVFQAIRAPNLRHLQADVVRLDVGHLAGHFPALASLHLHSPGTEWRRAHKLLSDGRWKQLRYLYLTEGTGTFAHLAEGGRLSGLCFLWINGRPRFPEVYTLLSRVPRLQSLHIMGLQGPLRSEPGSPSICHHLRELRITNYSENKEGRILPDIVLSHLCAFRTRYGTIRYTPSAKRCQCGMEWSTAEDIAEVSRYMSDMWWYRSFDGEDE